MSDQKSFPYRSARSGSFVAGLGGVLVVETVALHLLLVSRYPIVAWVLTLLSVLTLAWLVRDYVAIGAGAVRIDDTAVHLAIGRRFDLVVPFRDVARVVQPSFRDLPTPGTNQGRDYLNLTAPAAPNVLLSLCAATRVRAGALQRQVTRIGLHLDEPAAFVTELSSRLAETTVPAQ